MNEEKFSKGRLAAFPNITLRFPGKFGESTLSWSFSVFSVSSVVHIVYWR